MLRFGSFIGLIALIGLTVSGLVAYRAYGQDLALAIASIERAVDTHARLVQDRLNERDLLIRLIAGLISKSSLQGDVLAAAAILDLRVQRGFRRCRLGGAARA